MSEKDDAYWLELVIELPLKGLAKQIMFHVAPMPTNDENVFGLGFEPNGIVALSLNPKVIDDITKAFAQVFNDGIKVVFMPVEGCKNRTAAQLIQNEGKVH